MVSYHLSRVDDREADSRTVQLTESQMEWILNSLRLQQENQQRLASPGALIQLEDLGVDPGIPLKEGAVTAEDIQEYFRVQFTDVTELREQLVTLCGRDLTDG